MAQTQNVSPDGKGKNTAPTSIDQVRGRLTGKTRAEASIRVKRADFTQPVAFDLPTLHLLVSLMDSLASLRLGNEPETGDAKVSLEMDFYCVAASRSSALCDVSALVWHGGVKHHSRFKKWAVETGLAELQESLAGLASSTETSNPTKDQEVVLSYSHGASSALYLHKRTKNKTGTDGVEESSMAASTRAVADETVSDEMRSFWIEEKDYRDIAFRLKGIEPGTEVDLTADENGDLDIRTEVSSADKVLTMPARSLLLPIEAQPITAVDHRRITEVVLDDSSGKVVVHRGPWEFRFHQHASRNGH